MRRSRRTFGRGREPTFTEFCLLYVAERPGIDDSSPAVGQLTQDGIAAALGKTKGNVSRSLAHMRDRGWVEERTVHIRGGKRRRAAYFPTASGVSAARSLKAALEERGVRVELVDGTEADHPLHAVPELLGRPAHLTDVLMCLSNGKIRLADLEDRVGAGGRAAAGGLLEVAPVGTFIGRESELASIRSFLAIDGTLAVAIRGIAGIGKTTLAGEYARLVGKKRNVLWLPITRESSPLSILSAIVRFLASRTFRPLSGLIASGMEDARLTALLAAELARVAPLIVLDDLHKAPADLTSWVGELIRACRSAGRTQFILVSRTPLTVYDRSMVAREGAIRELTLRGLSEDAVSQFLRGRVPEDRLPEAVRIGGNPLYLKLIAERGFGAEEARRELEAFLEEEVVEDLSAGERRIVEQAAVFEGPAPREALLEMGSPSDLRSLVSREVLQRLGESAFVLHDAIREVSLRGVPSDRLRKLHLAAARILVASANAGDVLSAIRHYLRAAEVDRAVDLFVASAEDLSRMGRAPDLAAVLDSLPRRSPVRDRPDLLVAEGRVLEAVGRWDAAIRILRRAEAAAASDAHLLAQSRLALGRILDKRELDEEASAVLSKAKEAFEALGNPDGLAETLYFLGTGEATRGQLDAAQARFEEMRDIAFASGNRVLEGLAIYGLGRVADERRDFAGSERCDREALTILERTGSIVDVGRVLTGLGGVVQAQGRYDEALEILKRAIATARRSGDLHVLATGLYNLASLLNMTGRHEAAEAPLRECMALADDLGKAVEAANASILAGRIQVKKGDREGARRLWQAAEGMIRRIEDCTKRAACLRYLAMNCHHSGERELAIRYMREAQGLAEQGGHPVLLGRIAEGFRVIGVDV